MQEIRRNPTESTNIGEETHAQSPMDSDEAGSEILLIDGKEVARISNAGNMRKNEGTPDTSIISVDRLKECYEKGFSCG